MILKRLDDAIRDGDVIRAIIHNSGVNQDGKTNGITVPNGRAQSDLIKQVYAKAGLDPAECGFSECHGTGTKVGDPIEVAGIHEALGVGRSPRNPLFIGSVKSNVGHLEGASGIVSVIKAAMMLEKGMILPNANFETANPNIPLDQYNMKVYWLSYKLFRFQVAHNHRFQLQLGLGREAKSTSQFLITASVAPTPMSSWALLPRDSKLQ